MLGEGCDGSKEGICTKLCTYSVHSLMKYLFTDNLTMIYPQDSIENVNQHFR